MQQQSIQYKNKRTNATAKSTTQPHVAECIRKIHNETSKITTTTTKFQLNSKTHNVTRKVTREVKLQLWLVKCAKSFFYINALNMFTN